MSGFRSLLTVLQIFVCFKAIFSTAILRLVQHKTATGSVLGSMLILPSTNYVTRETMAFYVAKVLKRFSPLKIMF